MFCCTLKKCNSEEKKTTLNGHSSGSASATPTNARRAFWRWAELRWYYRKPRGMDGNGCFCGDDPPVVEETGGTRSRQSRLEAGAGIPLVGADVCEPSCAQVSGRCLRSPAPAGDVRPDNASQSAMCKQIKGHLAEMQSLTQYFRGRPESTFLTSSLGTPWMLLVCGSHFESQ